MSSENLEYLTEDTFSEESVFHGFFTRKGGTSKGLFAGLNCGLGSGDKKNDIAENRYRVAKEAEVEVNNLLCVYQEHGSKVITVKDIWSDENRPHADALVCDIPGIALSILTADCAPILFIGKKENTNPVIGAAHAGWKGALHGIIEETLEAMKALGVNRESVRACVGPCIAQFSYEVGNDFVELFRKKGDITEKFFSFRSKEGGAYFDLSGYCRWRLEQCRVKYVSIIDIDTYSNEDKFYSFRRATHNKERGYGRQVSVISIL